MADKLELALPKIVKLMLLILGSSTTDGEWTNAFEALMRTLKEVDPGGHGLVKRLEAPSATLNQIEIKAIFEAGRAQGRAEETVLRQRAVSVIASRVVDDISNGFNGYGWEAIAGHCLANLHNIPSNHHGFIEGAADRLAEGRALTKPMMEYLRNLFQRYLDGRIT